jgi:hypothetical protein
VAGHPTYHNVVPHSDAWLAGRTGFVGASVARHVASFVKSGESAGRRDLRIAKAVEILTGESAENGYTNADMERGLALEAAGLWEYQLVTGLYIQPCGYVTPAEVS